MHAAHPARSALRAIATAALLACVAIAGCAATPRDTSSDALRVIVLRHAEKGTDDPRDPTLAPAGTARAARIAERLANAPVVAVYATGYRRTQGTAAPTAAAHAVAVTTYDPSDLPGFVRQLVQAHPRGVVLVVGHSNTAPATVAALCDCEVAPMADDEFDRWTEVQLAPGQPPRVVTTRY